MKFMAIWFLFILGFCGALTVSAEEGAYPTLAPIDRELVVEVAIRMCQDKYPDLKAEDFSLYQISYFYSGVRKNEIFDVVLEILGTEREEERDGRISEFFDSLSVSFSPEYEIEKSRVRKSVLSRPPKGAPIRGSGQTQKALP